MDALKFIGETETEVEGLLVPFGGPINGRDIDGEYFSPNTDLCLSWFPDQSRPLLFHHGLDTEVKAVPVGRITAIEQRDTGHWIKGWLDKSHAYYAAVRQLIARQAVGLSSGPMQHLVRKSASGEILQWPLVEGSITGTPSNIDACVDFATAKSHFKSAGIDLDIDALKSAMDAAERDALPDSAFAYIDAEGERHLPVNDEAHARDALSRWDQTTFPDAATKKAALKKIIAACKRFDIEVSAAVQAEAKSAAFLPSVKCSFEDIIDDLTDQLNPVGPGSDGAVRQIEGTYPDYVDVCCYEPDGDGDYDKSWWRYPYVHDESQPEDHEITLGTPTRLQLAPAENGEDEEPMQKSFTIDAPFVMAARHIVRQDHAMKTLMGSLAERFVQEDLPLSSAKRSAYEQVAESWESGAKSVRDHLAAVRQKERAQADATARRQPEAIARRLQVLDLFLETVPEE